MLSGYFKVKHLHSGGVKLCFSKIGKLFLFVTHYIGLDLYCEKSRR